MKTIRWLICLAAVAGILSGARPVSAGSAGSDCVQGNGRLETVRRPMASFKNLAVDGAFETVVVIGEPNELSLTAEGNLLRHILTEVREGTLAIRPERSICPTAAIKVRVGTGRLEKLSSSGTNLVRLERLAGGGLEVLVDGSGSVYASGRVSSFAADIRGASEVMAQDLKAETVRVDISGAGEAEVYASRKIHVGITGMGTVVYHGNPPEVTQEITGLGDVIPR